MDGPGLSGGADELDGAAAEVDNPRSPKAIVEAPNKMKQPSRVLSPRRSGSVPVSIKNPSQATAKMAMIVPTVPSNDASSQCTAFSIGDDTAGSTRNGLELSISNGCTLHGSALIGNDTDSKLLNA